MATLSEWAAELDELRVGLGTTTPMLMRWFPRRELPGRFPLLWYASKRVRDRQWRRLAWEVALYAASAEAGARPVAIVDVAADAPMPARQPSAVEVAGRIAAGGAVALVMPRGGVVFAIGPVRQNMVMRRRRL